MTGSQTHHSGPIPRPRHVWFVNHYATIPSRDSHAGRHYYLANNLIAEGWTVSIIAASTQHPSGAQTFARTRLRKIEREGALTIVWLRANHYLGNGPARIANMLIFSILLVTPRILRRLPRPDVIVGSSVHPFAAFAASMLAKRYRVPFVFEPRDLWPETLIALGQLKREGALAAVMSGMERALFSRASLVVSPLPSVDKYMSTMGFAPRRFVWISNGIEKGGEEGQKGLPSAAVTGPCFSFGYLGSMGNANALGAILDAFDQCCQETLGSLPSLHLIGDGPAKAELMRQAAALQSADRIAFEPAIPKIEVIARASRFDCLVANMHDLEVYRYGISLNKLFDYLQAARPVIFATNAVNNPISEANAGICPPADDVRGIATAMSTIMETTAGERRKLGVNGLEHVLTHYTYRTLAVRLESALSEVLIEQRKGQTSEKI